MKNSKFKSVELHQKIDPVSHPTRAEGVVAKKKKLVNKWKKSDRQILEFCFFNLSEKFTKKKQKKKQN